MNEHWLRWAIDTAERLGHVEGAYCLETKKRVWLAIRRVFWDAVVRHGQSRGVTVEDIGVRLGSGRGVYNRWIAGTVVPNGEVVLAAVVLALRQNVRDLPLPDHRDIVRQVVEQTLAVVRAELGSPPAPFVGEYWRCCHRFLRHPQAFVPERPFSEREADAVLASVLAAHVNTGQARAVRTTKQLAAVLDVWVEPCALFLFGLAADPEVPNDV